MSVTVSIVGENGLDCATQLRNFFVGLQAVNPVATPEQAKAGVVGPKKAVKKVVEEDDEEEEAPKPKPKAKVAKKPVVEEDDEDEEDEPAPKKTAKKPAAKKAAAEDEEDEDDEPAPKKKAAAKKPEKAPIGELKDDGEEQPPTIDGCRVMIRRVAKEQGEQYSLAVIAEFQEQHGIKGGASTVGVDLDEDKPKAAKKLRQMFIDRCQEVIDDPDSIDLGEAE